MLLSALIPEYSVLTTQSYPHFSLAVLEQCPACGSSVVQVGEVPLRRTQIPELVERPVEVWEYQRPQCRCPICGWQGYAALPLGCREDFSYGALLS
jgi:transposase